MAYLRKNVGTVTGIVTQSELDAADDKTQTNLALLAFKTAVNGSLAKYNLQDQVIDEFVDATGIDGTPSTDHALAAGAYGYATPTITGGITGTNGLYTTHIFKSNANFVNGLAGLAVEYLIVAGGGAAGGYHGNGVGATGAGGAGGYRTNVSGQTSGRASSAEAGMTLAAATFAVVVGAAGVGVTSDAQGGDGGASSFNSIVSTGGGGGGDTSSAGRAGGSGGSPGEYNSTPGAGMSAQGFGGGASAYVTSGGGGGAGVAGTAAPDANAGGEGGNGLTSTIISHSQATSASVGEVISSVVWYAGGGGGGNETGGTDRAGGNGGGGTGRRGTADDGTDYTGGGGGAHTRATVSRSAHGGIGVVIIRYLTSNLFGDFTLQSIDTEAEAQPTKADMVMLIEDAGSGVATLGTHIKGYISRDSGTTFTEGTLVDEGDWGTDKRILAFHDLDISGQPADQTMCYKITTHSQSTVYNTKIHATSMGWR